MRNRQSGEHERELPSDERRTPKIWRTRAVADGEPERERTDPDLARMRANALREVFSAGERLSALPPPGALRLDGRDDDAVIARADVQGGEDRSLASIVDDRGGVERLREPGMIAEAKPRLALAAEPLDDASRHLVPRPAAQGVDERTQRQRDEDLPSTEPDGLGSEAIARIRDSVLSGLRLVEDARQKTPLDARVPEPVEVLLEKEKPTQPARAQTAPSDVFAPVGSQQRVLDPEAATPRDRPFRHIDHERPTEIDPRAAPTATMHEQPRERSRDPDLTEPIARHEIENEHERALVNSFLDTERAYFVLKGIDPIRCAHVEAMSQALKNSGAFVERDLVLAIHAREKRALPDAPEELRQGREDRVLALGLVAHDVDDAYRTRMLVIKEHLIDELDALPPEKRDLVYADFETFAEQDVANDSSYCRRELGRAIQREQELRPYVLALALDKQHPRPANDGDDAEPAADDASAARRRT